MGTIDVAKLVNILRVDILGEIETSVHLSKKAEYKFDPAFYSEQLPDKNLSIQKTACRTVVSLNFSEFQAKKVIRKGSDESKIFQPSELSNIVPSGARYAYDLIAFVGKKSYLEGCKLRTIHDELIKQQGLPNIPFSSLYDIQRKFLFYFGEVHRQAAPKINKYLHDRGKITWLIDGTIEPGTSVFFGIKEAYEGLFLNGWKIPTENETDISNCLIEAGKQYGLPDELLHDLSERMFNACEIAFPGRPHRVCHYHLTSDLGGDLYKTPHSMLKKRLREMKLQFYLKNQRSGQTQWLKQAIKEKELSLILRDILNGDRNHEISDSLGREVLLAIHGWLLDYPSDGKRQGFPFDPYLLYFHRRVAIVHDATQRLLSNDAIRVQLPKVLFSFSENVEKYLKDPEIVEATDLYENAFDIFDQIRSTLRLGAIESNPMHDLYELYPDEKNSVIKSLKELCEHFKESKRNCTDSKELKLYAIAIDHFEKYDSYLFPDKTDGIVNDKFVRTTNGIESHWSDGKRTRRQTHGRSKLTRDFRSLPAEYMLIPNLNNPRYVEIVLGNLDRLAEKLADAGKTAGTYNAWCNQQQPSHIGRLPTRLLRQENFIDELIGIYSA